MDYWQNYQKDCNKNRIFTKFIKCKNPDQKSHLNVQFKLLKNEITALTRESKKQYYETFFSANKNNLRKIWKAIIEIVNIKSKKFDRENLVLDYLKIDWNNTIEIDKEDVNRSLSQNSWNK